MRDIENRAAINGIAHRLLDLMAQGRTQLESDVRRVPASDYLDEGRFAAEKDLLFRRTPLVLAFSAELPELGSFKLHEQTGVSILMARNGQGTVKAFVNACRHRGAKLTDKPCGRQKLFTCPFHAWSYDLDGNLAALPLQDQFGDVDPATLGLIELPCEERAGMVFVIPTPGAAMDLDSFLGGGEAFLRGWKLETAVLIGQRNLETRANWKLALDTYCENYHFHVLHSADFSYKAPNCAYHWRYGDRGQHWCIAWPSKSLEDLRHRPEDQWVDAHQHFSILHFIYPNTIIAIYPETCSVQQIYPGAQVGDQTTKMTFFSREPNPSEAVKAVVEGRFETFYKVIQTEDYWVCGNIFENLESGLVPDMVFGRNEPALIWLHDTLDAALAPPLATAAPVCAA